MNLATAKPPIPPDGFRNGAIRPNLGWLEQWSHATPPSPWTSPGCFFTIFNSAGCCQVWGNPTSFMPKIDTCWRHNWFAVVTISFQSETTQSSQLQCQRFVNGFVTRSSYWREPVADKIQLATSINCWPKSSWWREPPGDKIQLVTPQLQKPLDYFSS